MAKGLMGLRRYQTGGGIGDPEDEWFERLYKQLMDRWFGTSETYDLDLPDYEDSMDRIIMLREGSEGTGGVADDLIGMSNLDITGNLKEGLDITSAPFPHAVPPRGAAIERSHLSDSGWNKLEEDLFTYALDQPVHDLDEAFRNNQVDDLIRGAGGEPPLSAALQREADIASLAESDIWNVDDRYKSKLPAYSSFDSPHRSGIGSLLNRLTSSSIPWGSIAAPLLAAAASPAALAAETAFDFAISPESLGGTASEVPGAGRTWRESPHIDPSDEEVASFMQTLLGDSPYSQSQLARPSTTSQRAIEELIRRAQAGTPVNRYRR